MRIALVRIQDHWGHSEGPEEKASRYTVRPGTRGPTLVYPHVVLAAGACRAGATRRDVRPFAVVWPGLDVTCESLAQSRRVGRGDEWRRQLTRAVRLDRLDVAG